MTGTAGQSETGLASTGSAECGDVFSGSLRIYPEGFSQSTEFVVEADVASLAQVGRVEGGGLRISATSFKDLSFLSCLHTVEGVVNITGNAELQSLEGLGNLETAEKLWVEANSNLESLEGVGPLRELEELKVGGGSLTELALDDLESVAKLQLGYCGESETPPADADFTALQEITGLASLTTVGEVHIAGQYELTSLGRLHDVAEAGGLSGPLTFLNNHRLPYAEIAALAEASGLNAASCGSLDGDPWPECEGSGPFSECGAPPP